MVKIDMIILGIETSCDDTSVAILEANGATTTVLSNIVSSQVKLHAKWGGIVPSLASREHAKNIAKVLKIALTKANKSLDNIDLIAVTTGPGLIVSLVIGTTFAKTLAWKLNKPIVGINHIEGHIYSNFLGQKLGNDVFPALCLVVSGGHTQLMLMENHGKYKIIGETLDDAAGEAFDKIARILDLGYPGGPVISKYAEKGTANAYTLPRPILNTNKYDFSFSGLKTAVLYLAKDLGKLNKSRSLGRDSDTLSSEQKQDIAASAQEAIVDVLATKTLRAAKEYNVKSLMLSGGVSANKSLRERLKKISQELAIPYFKPEMIYTGDNATMIAIAAYYNLQQKKSKNATDWRSIVPDSNWEII